MPYIADEPVSIHETPETKPRTNPYQLTLTPDRKQAYDRGYNNGVRVWKSRAQNENAERAV